MAWWTEWTERITANPLLGLAAVLAASIGGGALWMVSTRLRRRALGGVGAVFGRVGSGLAAMVGRGDSQDVWQARFEEVEERNQELRGFFVNFPEHVQRLNASLELDQVTNVIVRATGDMLDARSVQLFLLEADGGELRLVRHREAGLELAPPDGLRLRADVAPQAWVLSQQTAAMAEDWPSQHRGRGKLEIREGEHVFPIEIAAPVRLGERAVGLVVVSGMRGRTSHHQRVLSCWANVAGFSLENARRMIFTRELADTDRMTGLYNHARFHEELGRHFTRARNLGEELSLVVMDVDYFKAYNDRHGHPAGDLVLKGFASVLTSCFREGTHIARYGGEEFVVLLPGVDEQEARALAERACAAVRERRFKGGETQPLGCLTASAGVAALNATADSALELVAAADAALYASKRAGRDRVTSAAELPGIDEGPAGGRRRSDLSRAHEDDAFEVPEPVAPATGSFDVSL